MKQIIYVLIIISCIGCSSKGTVFEKADTDKGVFELYFIPHKEFVATPDIFEGFKISNSEIVKEIINSWEFEIVDGKRDFNPCYYLEIAKDNQTYIGRWINDSLNIIAGSKRFRFSEEILAKYKEHFKPLISNSVTIKSLKDSRNFIKLVNLNKGYLLFHKNDLDFYEWEKYCGSIQIEYLKNDLPNFNDSEEINKFLNKDFQGISEVRMISCDLRTSDSLAFFEILTESNITTKLPSMYRIKKNWEELHNVEIEIFNLKTDEIQSIARKNNIEIIDIKENNYR